MLKPIVDLLKQRDYYEMAAREQLRPVWSVIQAELGIAESLRTSECPTRLEMAENGLMFDMEVLVPASSWEKERRAAQKVTVPISALGEDPDIARKVMRREFPLACSRCGLFHRAGARACTSAAKCWGYLTWRSEVPQPEFYIETNGSYGYVTSSGPRKVRYAIDLRDHSLLGLQITPRHNWNWRDPVEGTYRDLLYRILSTVAADVLDAAAGRITTHADSACLSLDPPDWCGSDTPRTHLQLTSSEIRRLEA